MNKEIRWRIITLQSVLVVVFAAASGFLFFEGGFVTGMVHDELTAQQVYFPGTDQIKPGGALDPAKFPQEIRDQAGKQVTDGNQARIYANDFIGEHLKGTANGMTYATVGTKISQLKAQQAKLSKDDPAYADLQNQITTLTAARETLFKGETLRSILLNAYGWWTVGVYTTYAAMGMLLAALVVLGALVFELFIVGRKPESITVARKKAA